MTKNEQSRDDSKQISHNKEIQTHRIEMGLEEFHMNSEAYHLNFLLLSIPIK